MNKIQIISSAVELICDLDFGGDDFYQKCYTIIESALESENDNLKDDLLKVFSKHRKA